MKRSIFHALVLPATLLLAGVSAQAQLPVIPDDFSGIDHSLLHGTVTPPGAEIQEQFKERDAYDNLVFGYPDLTEAEITTIYFKDGAFEPVTDTLRPVYYPREDVKIARDAQWGVPHIYGLTDEAAAFGAGYAAVEDRLPIIQALNALGRAEAFELAGDSAAWLADAEIARVQGYTEDEFQAMIDRLPVVYDRPGKPDGTELVALLEALVEGMNAGLLQIQTGVLPLPDGLTLSEVLSIGPFSTTDVVAIVSIVRSLFGAGGGGELGNASRMLSLVNQYGAEDGLRIYEDFRNRFHNDGVVHTTDSFPYGQVPETIDPDSSPYPSQPTSGDPGLQVTFEELLNLFFGGGASQAQAQTDVLAEKARIKYENLVFDAPGGVSIDLSRPGQLSNYVVIDGEISSTGHPILLGGPQAGYFDPQILVENELHGDRIHARGAGFPGMGFVVIGRNEQAAWTPTAGGSDMVDIYIEVLCDPGGGPPTENSDGYMFNGVCEPMDQRTHRLAPVPNPDNLPDIIVERTIHGVVQARGLLGDMPVAVSRKRSTYLKELDAAIAILRLNRNEVPDGETFVRDFTESMNLSTNWAYANATEIAYVHGGLYPVRPANTHPDLPLWGTGEWEWQTDAGLANVERPVHEPTDVTDDVYLSDLTPPGVVSLHPHELAPERHYTISWNNRPAPDWSASDSQWGYSSLYRADMLEDLVLHEMAEGRLISPVRLVQIMEHAGLTDFRGSHILPEALEIIKQADDIRPREAEMIAKLEDWSEGWSDFANARGPLRRDGDQNFDYESAEAIGIMDAWWDPMIHAMFDTALNRSVNSVSRQGFHNAPGIMGSAFQGGFYGQVRTDLAMVLGNPLNSPTSQAYCGTTPGSGVEGALQECANALLASLEGIDPAPTSALAERIVFLPPTSPLGMHWVNRPTTQGLAMFGPPPAQGSPEPRAALMLAAGVVFLVLLQVGRMRRRH